ncbi:MAG: hypothetical protein GXP63_00735, partial [DPANN group archaeon]|nr:hypothetical protein [DPANN group archaeon]
STKTKALDQGDALLCDQIRDEAMKTSCKDNVYQNNAIQEGDVKTCEAISIPARVESCRNNVYANRAVNEKEPGLCDHITEETLRGLCKERFLS